MHPVGSLCFSCMLPAWFSRCRCNISYPSSHLRTALMHSYLPSAYDFWLSRSPPASVPACSAVAQILTGRKKKGCCSTSTCQFILEHGGAWNTSLQSKCALIVTMMSHYFYFFCMHFGNACHTVLQYVPNCTLLSFPPTFFYSLVVQPQRLKNWDTFGYRNRAQ